MTARSGVLGLVLLLGLVSFLAAATEGCGGSHHSSFLPAGNLTLTPPNGSILPPASTAAQYNQIVTVTMGGTPPYKFTPLSLPKGLTLLTVPSVQNEVQITGTPATVGSATITFQVVDSTNQAFTNASYSLTVN